MARLDYLFCESVVQAQVYGWTTGRRGYLRRCGEFQNKAVTAITVNRMVGIITFVMMVFDCRAVLMHRGGFMRQGRVAAQNRTREGKHPGGKYTYDCENSRTITHRITLSNDFREAFKGKTYPNPLTVSSGL